MLTAIVSPFPSAGWLSRAEPVRPRMTPVAANPSTPDPAEEHRRLAAALARGDKEALARLYDLLAKPLYSLALRITNDTAEAQDIIQDVFLQLWNKAVDYEPSRGSYFSWAATLTRNRALDRIRMRTRRAEIVQESAAEILPSGDNDLDSSDSLWLREKASAVRAALTALPSEQKDAIELAFFRGLTQQQIAEHLGEPLGTVKARIRRGLLRLRDQLSTRL
ncbi:MAG: sigma-70 family RNA polymerase sigma factor [Candidatus Didemnitutus sp.]|nr:sigma-70 family RNA polymerase sigma factor [Candidatus Didemnitutus sp.]